MLFFIKGVEYINTTAIEKFCRDSGYIPYQFINEFKHTFPKTNSNAQNIIDIISKQYNMDFNKHVLDSASQSNVLETEFSSFQQHGFSKQDYCKIFDKERKTIIDEKIKILQQKPNMYLD